MAARRAISIIMATTMAMMQILPSYAAGPSYFRHVLEGGITPLVVVPPVENPPEYLPGATGDIRIPISASRARIGVQYALALMPDNGTGPFAWEVLPGHTLPDGLSIVDGAIVGIPTEPGSVQIDLKATDSRGATGTTGKFPIDVQPAPVVTFGTTHSANSSTPSTLQPTASPIFGSATWSLVEGVLPYGLTLDGATGRIQGTVEQSGTFEGIVVGVVDADGASGRSAPFRIDAVSTYKVMGLEARYSTRAGSPFQTGRPWLSNASGSASFELTPDSTPLPEGLDLHSSGVIVGQPDAPSVTTGIYVRGTDPTGKTAVHGPIALNVLGDPEIEEIDNRTRRIESGFSLKPVVKNAIGSLEWSLNSGRLPSGYVLSSTSGTISGTGTRSGTSSDLILKAIDTHDGREAYSNAFSIQVLPTVSVSLPGIPTGTAGMPYETSAPHARGVIGIPSWSIVGALPDGLSISQSTGAITGTPTTLPSATLTFKVIDSIDNRAAVSDAFTIKRYVEPDPAVMAFATNPASYTAYVGKSFLTSVPVVRSSVGTLGFAMGSGTLPAWAGLNPTTGQLYGNAPQIGEYGPFAIKATDSRSVSAVGDAFTIKVVAVPTDPQAGSSSTFGPSFRATVGTYFSTGRPTSSGTSFSLVEGTLPSWANLDVNTGEINGTPDAVGRFEGLVVEAVDANDVESRSNPFDIVARPVGDNTVPVITGLSSLYGGSTHTAFVTGRPTVSGAEGAVVFSLASDPLTGWATLDPATGRISGTPTDAERLDRIVIRATDASGDTASSAPFSIDISASAPIAASVTSSNKGYVGKAFSLQPTVANARGTQSWSLAEGTLPAWATLNGTTGRITGTPDDVDTTSGLVLDVSDSTGDESTTGRFSIQVSAQPELTIATLPSQVVGRVGKQLVATTPTARDAVGTVSWSISGALPPGLTASSLTGIVSGVPTTAGTYPGVVVEATDDREVAARSTAISFVVEEAVLEVDPVVTRTVRSGTSFLMTSPALSQNQGTVSWSFVGGKKPSWATIDPATGRISGTTATGSTTGMSLKATESGTGRTATTNPFAIHVEADPSVVVERAHVLSTATDIAIQPVATGIVGEASWSIVAGTLPVGLALDDETGAISGRVADAGNFTGIALRVTDSYDGRSGTATGISLSFSATVPVVSIASASVRVGETVSLIPTATNTTTTRTWSLAQGTLPAWATLDPATGRISGTATSAADATELRIRVKDNTNATGLSSTFSIRAHPVLSASMTQTRVVLRAGRDLLTSAPSLSGSVGAIRWSSSGSLPAGVVLDRDEGVLHGIPSSPGTFVVTLSARDAFDARTVTAGAITIVVAGTATVSVASSNQGRANVASSIVPTVQNVIAPATYSLSGAERPNWLLLNTATGKMDLLPTASGTFGPFTLAVVDADGGTASSNAFSIAVSPKIAIASAASQDVRVGKAFAVKAPTITGSQGTVTFSIASGDKPSWAVLDATTGAITGTPPSEGTWSFALRAVDSRGDVAEGSAFSLRSYASPAIFYPAATVRASATLSHAPVVTGTVGSRTFSLVAGVLPDWLTMNSSGVLHGSTTTPQTVSGLQVRVRDADGLTATSSLFSVTVSPGISISTQPAYAETRVGHRITVPTSPAVASATGTVRWSFYDRSASFISLSSTTGAVGGIAESAGTFNYSLRATDASDGASVLTSRAYIKVWNVLAFTAAPANKRVHAQTAVTISPPALRNLRSPAALWSLNGTLPTWATLDPDTGVVTGTPTAADVGTTSGLSWSADDEIDGTSVDSAAFSITVLPPVAVSNVTTSYSARLGFPFEQSLPKASNAISSVRWTIDSGTLPQWATLDPATGQIKGTPQVVTNTANLRLRATDQTDSTFAQSVVFTLTVYSEPAMAISPTSYKQRVGTTVSIQPTATGVAGSRSWSISSGALPAGLTLEPGTGKISGSPTVSGVYRPILRLTDGYDGKTSQTQLEFTVSPKLVATTTNSSYRLRTAAPISTTGILIDGGVQQVTLVRTGTLPTGMSFNATTGSITGSPTNTSQVGTYVQTITATDAFDSAKATATISITVAAPLVVTPPAATNTRTGAVFETGYPKVVNALGTVTWSRASGTLPAGVVVNPSTGALEGSIAAISTASVFVRATDSFDNGTGTATVATVVNVKGPLTLGAIADQTGSTASPFTLSVPVAQPIGQIQWSTQNLPGGLSITPSTSGAATISGWPTASGAFDVVVNATDTADGATASQTFRLTVSYVATMYSFTSHTFTNCSTAGRSGPSLSNCTSAYSSAAWRTNTSFFNVSGGIQEWTAPATGTYRITANGARGGTSSTRPGGNGASVAGTFTLNQGEKIRILVGQQGAAPSSATCNAGGGGGTFVWRTTGSSLIMAAGGGGGGGAGLAGVAGTSNTGGTIGNSASTSQRTGNPGTSGNGGNTGAAGWNSNGAVPTITGKTPGVPSRPLAGGTGGAAGTTSTGAGGFGGGGGATGGSCSGYGAGGGGGYSGGASQYGSSSGGGGGGSFVMSGAVSPTSTSGANSGQGSVTIVKQ